MLRSPKAFLSFAFLLACCISVRTQSAAQDQTLDSYLKQNFTSIPGAAVSVIHNGAIVFEKGYGYADAEKKTLIDPNTRFELASVTKQVARRCELQHHLWGRIRLLNRT